MDKTARGHLVLGIIWVVIATIIGLTVGWGYTPAVFAIAARMTLDGLWDPKSVADG